MINLLPPDVKRDYRFARRNVGLRHWLVLIALAFVALGAISTYGLASLQRTTNSLNHQMAASDSTALQNDFKNTKAQVQQINSNFKLVLQVLSKEVLFSKLLQQIAAITPANTNLTGLNISQTTGAINISALTSDYNAATQLQVNLSDPNNKIFSKADLISVNCSGPPTASVPYPCTATVSALFANNNPFLFINNPGPKP